MPQQRKQIPKVEGPNGWTVLHRALTTPTASCRSFRVRLGDPLTRPQRGRCLQSELGDVYVCVAPNRKERR